MTNSSEYIVKTKPIHGVIGVAIGLVFLYLGLDLHFFHHISRWQVRPDSPVWMLFTGLGIAVAFGGGWTIFNPRTFLVANREGLTLYSGTTSRVWNSGKTGWDTTRRVGDACIIPWAAIREIGPGRIVTTTTVRPGTGVPVDVFDGTARLGAKHRTNTAPALQVLCDASVKLDGFGTGFVIKAWNGYDEESLGQMSNAERDKLEPRDRHSGFLIHHSLLNDSLPATIAILQGMQRREDA